MFYEHAVHKDARLHSVVDEGGKEGRREGGAASSRRCESQGKELLRDDIRATGTEQAVAAEASAGGSGLGVWLGLNGCSAAGLASL